MLVEVPELGRQRRRVGVEVEEDEALPRLAADRRQAVVGEAEVVEVLGVLRPDELAIEVVDPGVVWALEADGCAARLLDDGRPPMAADVVERPELASAAADDEERLAVELGQEVGPGIGRLVDPADDDPVAAQDVLALPVEDRRVVVRPARAGGGRRGRDAGRNRARAAVRMLVSRHARIVTRRDSIASRVPSGEPVLRMARQVLAGRHRRHLTRRASGHHHPAMKHWPVLRIVRALSIVVVLAAIVAQAKVLADAGAFDATRFFAFFTIQSNLIGVAAFSWLVGPPGRSAVSGASSCSGPAPRST